MKEPAFISELPNNSAVYALLGGHGRRKYFAYVGIANQLRRRIEQHLVNRDSSVAVRTSATGINPDHVTQVIWWEDHRFENRDTLRVAEMIASSILDPALRSRGGRPKEADELLREATFPSDMKALFEGEPTGKLEIPTLQDAIERISQLEHRIARLEDEMRNSMNRSETKGMK